MKRGAKSDNKKDESACKWESGELGMSEEHAVPSKPEHERSVDKALGMQLISIRLPVSLIKDLKTIAGREGLGYQPLARRVLQRFTAAEFKAIAGQELSRASDRARDEVADTCSDEHEKKQIAEHA